MKRNFIFLFCFALFVSFSACKSLKKMNLKDVASNMPTDSMTSAVSGGVDFKNGEVLCGIYDGSSARENTYRVARVLTQASSATKNQAQVLFLSGKEKWVKTVILSHKARKAELKIGKHVLCNSQGNREELDQNLYRKNVWYIGRVTSTDEFFKNIVEVKGQKYNIKWVRVPAKAVK